MIRPFMVLSYNPKVLYSGSGEMASPGVTLSRGFDGMGSDAESSGRTEGRISPIRGMEEREGSAIPACRSALPQHSAAVRTNAQTSSREINRKRDRICFMAKSFQSASAWDESRILSGKSVYIRARQLFVEHGQMSILTEILLILSGDAAQEPQTKALRAKVGNGGSQQRESRSG